MRRGRSILAAVLAVGAVAFLAWRLRPRTPTAGERLPDGGRPAAAPSPALRGVHRAAEPKESESASSEAVAPAPADAAAKPPEPPAAGKGVLRVLVSVGDAPRSHATVRAVRLDDRKLLQTVETAENGFAELHDVDPDGIEVQAFAEGFRVGSWDHTWRNGDFWRDEEGVVHVRIERGIPLDGRVLEAETDLPIAGASVLAHDWSENVEFGPTDAEGRFHVPGVMNDNVAVVTAWAPGHVTGRVNVHVDGGVVRPASVVLRLAAGGRVVGTVRSPDGSPVAGALVTVSVQGPEESPSDEAAGDIDPSRFEYDDDILGHGFGSREDSDVVCRSGPDGAFRADGLAYGTAYAATATAAGWASAVPVRGLTSTATASEGTATLRLRRAAKVVVRVKGPPSDPAEALRARVLQRGTVHKPERDAEGSYVFDGLDPGSAEVFVQAAGFRTVAKRVLLDEGGLRAVEFELEAGSGVEGVVADETGRPLGDAEVSIASAAKNQGITGRYLSGERKAKTDAQGRFEVSGLEPGGVLLVAEWTDWTQRIALGTRERIALQAPARGVRVTLHRLGGMRARLVTPDGKPFVGEVWTWLGEGSSGGGGSHRIDDGVVERIGLLDGEYSWTLRAEGFAWIRRMLTVHDGATLDLGDLVLDSGLSVSGRVLDGAGHPVAGAKVTCIEVEERSTLSDAEGRFALDRFPRERFSFSIEREEFELTTLAVDPSRTTGLEVRLHRPGHVRGVVKTSAGKAAAQGDIVFRRPDAKPVRETFPGPDGTPVEVTTYADDSWAQTDEAGKFEASLTMGRWIALWQREDGEPLRLTEFALDDGETRDLVLVLPP